MTTTAIASSVVQRASWPAVYDDASQCASIVALDPRRAEASPRRDAHTFELLLQEHSSVVYGYLVRWLGSRSLADDVFQDAAVKAYNNFAQLRDLKSFRCWMIRIATNQYRLTVLSSQRRKARERTWHQARRPHDDCVEDRTNAAWALQHGFAALKPSDRQVLLLRFVEGLSHAEIADMLEVPVAVVKMRVSRARRRFTRALATWEPT